MITFRRIILSAALFMLLISSSAFALIGGVLANPSTYVVTVTKIEFQKTDGTFVTFASGASQFDIASVGAGQAVGTLALGQSLPAGSYTGIRITFSRTFGMTGAVADANGGQPARTNTGNAATQTAPPDFTSIGVATTDGAAGTLQQIPVPFGTAVTTALTAEGIEEVGTTELRMTVASAFTVLPEQTVPPAVRVDFDVTGGIEFLTTGVGTAIVIPTPPSVNVTVG
jgi:hypothetical protein